MTALPDHRPSTDRAELVLTQRQLRGCAVMFVCGEIDVATVGELERAGTRLLENADLDTALETVSDRAGASS